MATLPRAVQRQLEQADALLNPQPAPNPLEPTPVTVQPAEVPPAPVAVDPPTPAPTPAPAVSEETWEKKYKTLQGLFNAKVPELQRANAELSTRLNEVVARLDQAAQQPQPPAAPQKPTLDPKDIEDFGQDLVDMVQRQFGSLVGPLVTKVDAIVADVDKRLSALEGTLNATAQTVAVTAEDRFFERLTELVSDWEALNGDEAFHAWLLEEDPVYGVPRQAALTAAQKKLDAERAAKVFIAYKGTVPAAPRVDPLAKQVSPKASAAAPVPGPAEKPVITQKAVEAFYKDVAQGKYRGRAQEQQRLEGLINEALAEGRIR